MLRVTLKGLLAHKVRLALTSFAVIVGVAFVVGSVVLTDSVRAEFDSLLEEINSGIDLSVRAEEQFESQDFGGQVVPVSDELVEPIQGIDGVAEAAGFVQGLPAIVIDPDGEAVLPQGPPLGINWYDSAESDVSVVRIVDGREPESDNEVVLDIDLAEDSRWSVGDTIPIQTGLGPAEYEFVGTMTFGDTNALAGATLAAFTTPEAQRIFNLEGQYNQIDIAIEEGADIDAIEAEVADILPEGVEVVQADELIAEQQDELGSLFDIFGNVLLGFAGVALFVSAFLINNTFTIVVGQRVRELALLRAVGATGRQVALAITGEAFFVGAFAAVLGFLGGLGMAFLLSLVLNSAGFGSGSTTLVLSASPFISAAVIGVGITVASAILPAWKASTVPPVAAMREGFELSGASIRTRSILGIVLVAVGALAIAYGLGGSPPAALLLLMLIAGAIAVFLGVAALSPTFAAPVARIVGAPFGWLFRTPGRLARANAARNPRRTSSTASALMIGLALVSMALVVGESVKASVRDTLGTSITADWYIDGGFIGFSPDVVESMEELDEVTSVSGGRFGQMEVDGSTKDFSSVDYAVINDLFDLDLQEGGQVGEGSQGLLIHSDPADDLGISTGDTLDVVFQTSGGPVPLEVLGVYDDSSVLGNWVIDLGTYDEYFTEAIDVWAAAKTADGSTPEAARAALETTVVDYPQLEIQDREEFAASFEENIDQVLVVVTVFLVLAVLIAFLGIMNTLALSVFERTREIGLLRAVGETRRQVFAMVTLEAVIVSVFGALLGVAIGLVFGFATANALPAEIVTTVQAPWRTLVTLVVLAGLIGMVAAIFPAWRASRLNVLDAITFE